MSSNASFQIPNLKVTGSSPVGVASYFNELQELCDRLIKASKHIVSALDEFHARLAPT